MMGIARTFALASAAVLALTGCHKTNPANENAPQAAVPGSTETSADNSQRDTEILKSEIEALNARVDYLEELTKKTKRQADEAHDIAGEARDKADEACKPMGYQYGCGNSP